jgi:hypothetical protein
MLDLSGLWYRAYTVCPFLFCCGVLIISAFAFPKGKKNKDSGNTKTSIGVDQKIGCFIGALAIIFAFVCLGYYLDAIYHPRVNSIDGVFVEEYRSSYGSSPAPFTNSYIFKQKDCGDADFVTLYLDSFSEKKIVNQKLVPGERYTVYFSEQGKVILCLISDS